MNRTEDRAHILRNYRLLNWRVDLVERLETKFHATIHSAQKDEHFEKLYSYRNDEIRTIQLNFGSHPIGASLQGNGLAIENGSTLVFSQGADGSVYVILYPYKSELMQRKETYITWNVFHDPTDVTNLRIDAAIADFWRYSRVSSSLNGGSLCDRIRIGMLVNRGGSFVPMTDNQITKKPISLMHRALNSPPVLLIAFLSAIATLSGVSIPSLLNKFNPSIGMKIIEGHYTLCPNEPLTTGSPRWLNFLYDIDDSFGKIVFFDVNVSVECLVGKSDLERLLGRTTEEGSVEYAFRYLPLFDIKKQQYIAELLDGQRDIKRLPDIIPDNGAYVLVHGDQTGRNAYSRLQVNAEGLTDVIYGPFLIKKGGEDGFVTFELSPPVLDSVNEADVSRIANERAMLRRKQ